MPTRDKTPRRGGTAQPNGSESLTDPLFVPHLDALGLGDRVAEAFTAESTEEADLYRAVLESICGAVDDSQPVEMYDGTLGVPVAFVNNHQRAVAQVQWNDNLASLYTDAGNVSGVRWGTGTMIGPDLFLTCGHLFDQAGGGWQRPRQNGTNNIISPQEIATNMRLNFDFQVDSAGNPRTEQSFAITQLIEYRLGGIDMALCRVAGNPGNTFGWANVSTVDAAVNDMICIIGHPAGMRKRIEAGPTTAFGGNEIRYNDIDTLGGNSGSGILLASNGQLVGVHTNGGCNAAGTGSNFGMRITSIRANSPTLRGLRGGGATGRAADIGPIVTAPSIDQTTGAAADIGPVLTNHRLDKAPLSDLNTRILADVGVFTNPIADKTIGSDVGTRKGLDDVKHGAFDKHPAFEAKAPFDNPVVRDPGRGIRPFILSTPHHSAAAASIDESLTPEGTSRGQYDAALAQLELSMAEHRQRLVELEGLYDALRAECQELWGG